MQPKPDPVRDDRIREEAAREATKEAEEKALKKWSKELEMSSMKFKAQLDMKQETINTLTMKLESQVTLCEKTNEDLKRL